MEKETVNHFFKTYTLGSCQDNLEKKNKDIEMEKEKVNQFLFADDMILYVESPKKSAIKLLELINESSKVAGCKINTQKLIEFLPICNKQSKMKLCKKFNKSTKSVL